MSTRPLGPSMTRMSARATVTTSRTPAAIPAHTRAACVIRPLRSNSRASSAVRKVLQNHRLNRRNALLPVQKDAGLSQIRHSRRIGANLVRSRFPACDARNTFVFEQKAMPSAEEHYDRGVDLFAEGRYDD